MREINIDSITNTIEKLCIKSNHYLGNDVLSCLEKSYDNEESDTGKHVIKQIINNAKIAQNEKIAICQDTGMVVAFIEIGCDVHVSGGSITDAVNEGVRRGYEKGYLRKSIVSDPIKRVNTKDNTPAVTHYEFVEGENISITVVPKGFGSENMGAVKMLKPSEGVDGIKKFVIDTVDRAGANPCPPIIVGVGIGGTMEKAAIIAKKALIRPIGERSGLVHIRKMEEELLTKINKLGIGPAGFGGKVTALSVNIETYPTHIAGLPVAVNLNCHAARHASAIL